MSGAPWLTIVVPTQGRPTLPRALQSIRSQGDVEAVEIIVVADTHSPMLSDALAVAREYDCRYVELDAGTHAWGYPQIQRGYELARGDWMACIGDDDVYEPGAVETIRRVIDDERTPLCPLLFRVELHPSPTRGCYGPTVIWTERRLERGDISTQNAVVPNMPPLLGHWWDDFCFIEATVNKWGGCVVWRPELIARCY